MRRCQRIDLIPVITLIIPSVKKTAPPVISRASEKTALFESAAYNMYRPLIRRRADINISRIVGILLV
jgi:hypothetical protein